MNVQVISFGYTDEENVRNRHPKARQRLSESEVEATMRLVDLVFQDTTARTSVFPFDSKKLRFLGGIEFSADWVA